MAWYDDAYARRVPIVVDDRAGSGSRDVTAAVPSTLSELWDTIQADGDDIRVTLDDGVTPVTYQWSGFSYANRTGSVQVDNATAPQAAMNVLWLYFGNAAATSGAGSFTASSARTGHIVATVPGPSVPILQGLAAGQRPPSVWVGATGESRRIWWDLTGILSPLRAPSEGQTSGQEVQAVIADAQDSGAGASSLWVAGSERVIVTPDGRTLAGYIATGGADGGRYTDRLKVWTSDGELYVLSGQRNTYTVQEP
jgi:hypothetical protein